MNLALQTGFLDGGGGSHVHDFPVADETAQVGCLLQDGRGDGQRLGAVVVGGQIRDDFKTRIVLEEILQPFVRDKGCGRRHVAGDDGDLAGAAVCRRAEVIHCLTHQLRLSIPVGPDIGVAGVGRFHVDLNHRNPGGTGLVDQPHIGLIVGGVQHQHVNIHPDQFIDRLCPGLHVPVGIAHDQFIAIAVGVPLEHIIPDLAQVDAHGQRDETDALAREFRPGRRNLAIVEFLGNGRDRCQGKGRNDSDGSGDILQHSLLLRFGFQYVRRWWLRYPPAATSVRRAG